MKNLHSIAAALCGTLLLCGTAAKGAPQEKKTLSMKEDYISQVRDWSESRELRMMPTMQWEAKREYKIVYRAPEKQMVSFRVWEWAYVGGAHGMPETVVGTFKNGRRLKLKDIAPTREKRLRLEKSWQQAIARHFKAKSFEAHLKTRPHFKPRMTENFFLNEKGRKNNMELKHKWEPYDARVLIAFKEFCRNRKRSFSLSLSEMLKMQRGMAKALKDRSMPCEFFSLWNFFGASDSSHSRSSEKHPIWGNVFIQTAAAVLAHCPVLEERAEENIHMLANDILKGAYFHYAPLERKIYLRDQTILKAAVLCYV